MAFAGTDSLAQYDFTLTAEAHRRNIQNEVSDNIINFAHNDSMSLDQNFGSVLLAFPTDPLPYILLWIIA